MGISTCAMRSCLGKPGLLHMKPFFSYSVNSKQVMDLHFNQHLLAFFCNLFVMPPLAMSSDFISRHGFSMCRKVGNKSLRISWPLARNPWIDGCGVAAKRTTSCNKRNLNQPKCGQMKKWHGAWQETCILGICNSRTLVYLQRSRNSELWKVAFRHVAQNENKFCCKKVDVA